MSWICTSDAPAIIAMMIMCIITIVPSFHELYQFDKTRREMEKTLREMRGKG